MKTLFNRNLDQNWFCTDFSLPTAFPALSTLKQVIDNLILIIASRNILNYPKIRNPDDPDNSAEFRWICLSDRSTSLALVFLLYTV